MKTSGGIKMIINYRRQLITDFGRLKRGFNDEINIYRSSKGRAYMPDEALFSCHRFGPNGNL